MHGLVPNYHYYNIAQEQAFKSKGM